MDRTDAATGSLAVIDLRGTLTFGSNAQPVAAPAGDDADKGTTRASHTRLRRVDPLLDADDPSAPIVVAHRSRAFIHVNLFRGAHCCGGLSFVVRAAGTEPAAFDRPDSYAHIRAELPVDRQFHVRVLIPREALLFDPQVAVERALLVAPASALRLPFEGGGRRQRISIATPAMAAVADIEASTWSRHRPSTERFVAGIEVTAREQLIVDLSDRAGVSRARPAMRPDARR